MINDMSRIRNNFHWFEVKNDEFKINPFYMRANITELSGFGQFRANEIHYREVDLRSLNAKTASP
jgi:hypothetical protein